MGDRRIKPEASTRVLGVIVDYRLEWKKHHRALQEKLVRQTRAIERLVRSAWGPSLVRSRLIYTAVVRAAIGYGSIAWHRAEVRRADRLTKKPLKALQTVQNIYL